MPKIKNMEGQRFGRLTVAEYAGQSKDRHALWICKCDCGNAKTLQGNTLKQGLVKSCGCLNDEMIRSLKLSHGDCGNRLHTIWKNMRQRCLNPKHPRFKDYGGRGIGVSSEWSSYKNFRRWALDNGYSDSLSIDRIDNDGNYEPGNCRWATVLEQAHNKGRKVDIYVNSHQEAIQRGKIQREVRLAT